jgi:cyclopropane fatty-acyl-phospholipid synthase-like methyltransferase
MSSRDFEARYRAEPDPWGYETSAYERAKYDATVAACGPGPYRRGLELGSSIGVLSGRLAPLCETLVTIDAAPTAVAAARTRLAALANVSIVLGEIPEAVPTGSFDLVVASEILYYLQAEQLVATIGRLWEQLQPGGRLVAVHWRHPGSERPFTAAEVHDYLRGTGWLEPAAQEATDDYLLDVLVRR